MRATGKRGVIVAVHAFRMRVQTKSWMRRDKYRVYVKESCR